MQNHQWLVKILPNRSNTLKESDSEWRHKDSWFKDNPSMINIIATYSYMYSETLIHDNIELSHQHIIPLLYII